MSVAISWANKIQLAKCDIMVGFPISSHIYGVSYINTLHYINHNEMLLHVKFTILVQSPIATYPCITG